MLIIIEKDGRQAYIFITYHNKNSIQEFYAGSWIKVFPTLCTYLHNSHRKVFEKELQSMHFHFSGSWNNDAGNMTASTFVISVIQLADIPKDVLVQRSITNLYFILLDMGREGWDVMNTNYWPKINVYTDTLFFNLFFYFWLCWVFIVVRGLSLVVVSRGYSSLRCVSFSLRWLLLLQSTGSRRAGFSCGTQAQ